MMPATIERLPTGAAVLMKRCEGCNGPAYFGENVNMRAAMDERDAKRAGRWWCSWADGKPCCGKAGTND